MHSDVRSRGSSLCSYQFDITFLRRARLMTASLLIETRAEGDTETGVVRGEMRLRMRGFRTQRVAFMPHSVSPCGIVAVHQARKPERILPERILRLDIPDRAQVRGSASGDMQPVRPWQGVPRFVVPRFDADVIRPVSQPRRVTPRRRRPRSTAARTACLSASGSRRSWRSR